MPRAQGWVRGWGRGGVGGLQFGGGWVVLLYECVGGGPHDFHPRLQTDPRDFHAIGVGQLYQRRLHTQEMPQRGGGGEGTD